MNEHLKNWIEALRSGNYKQTRFMLERKADDAGGMPPGNCCLGVAAEVIGVPGMYPDLTKFGLPREAECKLMQMNDDERKTFAEIADYLEKLGRVA
jgi:hypothetical protein